MIYQYLSDTLITQQTIDLLQLKSHNISGNDISQDENLNRIR